MTATLDIAATKLRVEARSFQLMALNLSSASLFSGELVSHGPLVQRWQAKLSFPTQKEADWREWDAIIADLGGTAGTLRAFDPARRQPYFNRIATPTVETWDDATTFSDSTAWESGLLPPSCAVDQAAYRGATDLVLRGLPASLAAALRGGDLFELRPNGLPAVHGHLYLITRTANTDATGRTRVVFRPPLRAGVADGDMVVLRDPRSVFRLGSDDQGEIQVTGRHLGRFGLTLIETLPVP